MLENLSTGCQWLVTIGWLGLLCWDYLKGKGNDHHHRGLCYNNLGRRWWLRLDSRVGEESRGRTGLGISTWNSNVIYY